MPNITMMPWPPMGEATGEINDCTPPKAEVGVPTKFTLTGVGIGGAISVGFARREDESHVDLASDVEVVDATTVVATVILSSEGEYDVYAGDAYAYAKGDNKVAASPPDVA